MKKITLLLFFLAISIGYAQPGDNAATPTNDPGDVISIYSDAYTDVATNYDPNWGQSGVGLVNPTFDPTSGGTNFVLAYPNFNYQGTELTTQNASGMEYLHIDIWTSNATDVKVTPINNGTGAGEFLVNITLVNNGWSSVDIPKSSFTGMTWDSVFQIKFDGQGGTTPSDIYLDNIYFWKAPVVIGTDATLSDLQVDDATVSGFNASAENYVVGLTEGDVAIPQITTATTTDVAASTSISQASGIPGDATVLVTAQDGTTTKTYTVSFEYTIPNSAPTPPSIIEANVISIFSDAYTDVAATWNPAWGQSTVVTDEVIATNNVKKYSNFSFSGIEPTGGTIDASAPLTHVNLSYWTSDATELKIKLVDYRGDGAWGGDNIEVEIGKPVTAGSWEIISIPLSEFTDANASFILSDIGQLVLSAVGAVNPVYIDDFYFSVGSALAVENYEIEGLNAYPNPTMNSWNISTENEIINSIEIFNVLGKSVISLRPSSREVTIDASNLATGMYFSVISTDAGASTRKLIKK